MTKGPSHFLCGCEKTPENSMGNRRWPQCRRCKMQYNRDRKAGRPTKVVMPRVTETHFTCGHPRTPQNTVGGGVAYAKGRCKTCRHAVQAAERARRSGKAQPLRPAPVRRIAPSIRLYVPPRLALLQVPDSSGRSYSLFPRRSA